MQQISMVTKGTVRLPTISVAAFLFLVLNYCKIATSVKIVQVIFYCLKYRKFTKLPGTSRGSKKILENHKKG